MGEETQMHVNELGCFYEIIKFACPGFLFFSCQVNTAWRMIRGLERSQGVDEDFYFLTKESFFFLWESWGKNYDWFVNHRHSIPSLRLLQSAFVKDGLFRMHSVRHSLATFSLKVCSGCGVGQGLSGQV